MTLDRTTSDVSLLIWNWWNRMGNYRSWCCWVSYQRTKIYSIYTRNYIT